MRYPIESNSEVTGRGMSSPMAVQVFRAMLQSFALELRALWCSTVTLDPWPFGVVGFHMAARFFIYSYLSERSQEG